MKRLIIIGIVACTASLIFSCMSDEKKLAKLIEENTKKDLFYPDSYDPVELTCDSLFSGSFITDENVERANRYVFLESMIPIGYTDEQRNIEKDSLFRLLQADYWDHDEFTGWLVYHRYRAKTNSGTISFGEYQYFLDIPKSQVLRKYDIDRYDFKKFVTVEKRIIDVGYEDWLNYKNSRQDLYETEEVFTFNEEQVRQRYSDADRKAQDAARSAVKHIK